MMDHSWLSLQTEEQLKKRVGAKLEVARFLQDTVSEMAKDMRTSKTGATQASAADLYQFMKRGRVQTHKHLWHGSVLWLALHISSSAACDLDVQCCI